MKFYNIVDRVKAKAIRSPSKYHIGVIGMNIRGEIIGTAFNRPRFNRFGGGIHAEMALMRKCGKDLKTIILCRVGATGNVLPIHPCKVCKTKADELNIKIVTIDKL